MRALAWDDKPEYFQQIAKSLEQYEIRLEVVKEEDLFVDKFRRESWDFVITDLVAEGQSEMDEGFIEGESSFVGERLAWGVANSPGGSTMPIFVITQHYNSEILRDVRLPSNAITKSKSTHAGWMADDIYHELVQRGVYVNSRKVFLIYGHDAGAEGARQQLEHALNRWGLAVEAVSGKNLTSEIAAGLLRKMNDCAAFVAICTPDDKMESLEGLMYHPRHNVLLEIGMAMGLSRGLHRLTIIQKWGSSAEDRAHLPSDLGGVVTIRLVGDNLDRKLKEIEGRLKELKVDLRPLPD
jgi:predicted nucleotide-binding protein